MNFLGPNSKNFISQPIDTCPDFTDSVQSWSINSVGNTLNTWKTRVLESFAGHLVALFKIIFKSNFTLKK